MFFDAVYYDEDEPWLCDLEALESAVTLCRACPVRRECAVDIINQENGIARGGRYGVTAGMTPPQRWSVERRGVLRCACGHVRDPIDLVAGRLHCPKCDIDRSVPSIPVMGDRWAKRHTTIARKLVPWITQHVPIGEDMPTPTELSQQMDLSIHDILCVYEGFVADGTLSASTGKRPTYTRVGKLGAARSWAPAHMKR